MLLAAGTAYRNSHDMGLNKTRTRPLRKSGFGVRFLFLCRKLTTNQGTISAASVKEEDAKNTALFELLYYGSALKMTATVRLPLNWLEVLTAVPDIWPYNGSAHENDRYKTSYQLTEGTNRNIRYLALMVPWLDVCHSVMSRKGPTFGWPN